MKQAHLLSVWGVRAEELPSLPLMKYWFKHYADCGVRPQNMHVTLMTNNPEFAKPYSEWMRDFGISDILQKDSPRFNFFEVTYERQQLQQRVERDEWIINPDMDELIAFQDSVPNLVRWLTENDYNYIDGDVRDRFAKDYLLKGIIDDLPLHLQFPLAFDFTNGVLGANPRKVVLSLNCFTIEIGCHWLGNCSPQPFKYSPLRFEIDHFKWDAGLKTRCERLREFAYSMPEGRVPWRVEYDILLDCIEGDRINVFKYRNKQLIKAA
jgi:hypothetical protein